MTRYVILVGDGLSCSTGGKESMILKRSLRMLQSAFSYTGRRVKFVCRKSEELLRKEVSGASGVWFGPGKYDDVASARSAIGICSNDGIPALGTGFGFQQMLLWQLSEKEKRALGHEEFGDTGNLLFVRNRRQGERFECEITSCPVGGSFPRFEVFFNRFSVNEKFHLSIDEGEVNIIGFTRNGELAWFKNNGNSFFCGTAYVPEMSNEVVHPIVREFVAKSCKEII